MTVTQTVDIPDSRRLTIDVPSEVLPGRTILTFTPAPAVDDSPGFQGGCPLCAAHRDPVTGELRLNAETIASLEEGEAMLRGEIPAKRFHSFEEMWEDLNRDDPDD